MDFSGKLFNGICKTEFSPAPAQHVGAGERHTKLSFGRFFLSDKRLELRDQFNFRVCAAEVVYVGELGMFYALDHITVVCFF